MFDNAEFLFKMLAGNNMNYSQTAKLTMQNSQYIQKLNQNMIVIDKNIQSINSSIKELARDTAALQRAVIEFLKEKGLIQSEEDIRLLQKLHMRHIAQLDQEIADKREDTAPPPAEYLLKCRNEQ